MVTRYIDALDAANTVVATHTETDDGVMSWDIPTIFPGLTPGETYNFVMRTGETAGYVVPTVPVITGVPTISGTAEVGQTLTATPASVTGTPTPTRTWQWERNGTPIGGATASTYTLVLADDGTNITVVQTETNAGGSDSAESDPVAVAPPLVLDSLSAGAAYSPRLLRTLYGPTNPCVRVRRSNDNALANIPFKMYPSRGNTYWLDEDALLAHCGANSGFVETKYDQSGNGRHISETVNANQPMIVNAGVIVRENGLPSIDYNGTSQRLFTSSAFMFAAGAVTCFAVVKSAGGNSKNFIVERNSANGQTIYGIRTRNFAPFDDMTAFVRNDAGTAQVTNARLDTGIFDNTLKSIVWKDTGAQMTVADNGVAGTDVVNYTRTGAYNFDRFGVMATSQTTTGECLPGRLSELIVMLSAVDTATQNLIAQDQGEAYGITVNFI